MDYLVVGQVLPFNPAAAVRGPKHVVKVGKTPVLFEDDARKLFEAIDTSHVVGLRDRAMIGVMIFTRLLVSAPWWQCASRTTTPRDTARGSCSMRKVALIKLKRPMTQRGDAE